ncbi:DEAD/DEAH box helicase [Bacillus sp. FJAT-47783]|uniref:DEAD/DEAH box helicase n=1 Tax=Bacillus sp. FJAT-47783 TaxID=2922712 RepID=UPI001FAD16C5|nr:DEAD/DEAH box helicase [Bacillus sp. FJAT-47783]
MATKFTKFSFQPFLIDAIESLRFYEPTEIQERMIPLVLSGKSAIGQSQTGTGKTHSYLLPLIEKIDRHKQEVQVVITAPTRELARQIYQEVLKVTKFSEKDVPIQARLFIGGTDKLRTIDKLKTQPHIVVGTPGRIFDLVKDQALNIHTATSLVVDEADLMLDLGFIYEVDQIASRLPEDLQMLVFSATIPEKLKPFLKKYMENPEYAHVEPKKVTAEKVEQILVPQRHRNKVNLVHDILVSLNPYLAIVFVNTKTKADEMADALLQKGLKVGRIHGGLTPRERKKMMRQINDLDFQYIVATDLAARGIDIEGVSHIINAEIPSDLDFYIHRVGRTARAGHSGFAYTIYDEKDEEALLQLEKRGIEFENMDIQAGTWNKIDDRHRRKKRKKQANEADMMAKRMVKKPKKVKPGYKKKMKEQMEQIKKKQYRARKKGK